jgi:monoamine oxidase
MGRSLLFQDLKRAIQIGVYARKNHLTLGQGIEQLALQASATQSTLKERETQLVGTNLGGVAMQLERTYVSPQLEREVKIGIVGAGLAGLACGYELKQQGISATIYEASDRVGGRCYSLGGASYRTGWRTDRQPKQNHTPLGAAISTDAGRCISAARRICLLFQRTALH